MPPQISTRKRSLYQQLPPEVLPSGVPKKFLLSSAILFLISILIYWGLSIGYTSFLNRSILSLEEEVDNLAFQVTSEQQETLVTLYSQINNLRDILKDHIYGAQLFPVLERNTHVNVAYRSIGLLVPDRQVIIEGVAGSYDDLVSQLAIYEAAPEIKRLTLESSAVVGNTVNFKILLTLEPGVLKISTGP